MADELFKEDVVSEKTKDVNQQGNVKVVGMESGKHKISGDKKDYI